MDGAMKSERRAAARVRFCGGILPPAARIHPGRDVIVVDLSRTGALVEGVWRLRPGARVDLQLHLTVGGALVRGRIERCYVASLNHPEGVRYRAAIRFDSSVAFVPPVDLLDGYSVPVDTDRRAAVFGHRLPERPSRRMNPSRHVRKA
jgi:hypothetical protein